MKIEPLEKIYVTNTDYTLENYSCLVITAIGTDDTADVTISIDGKVCGIITNYAAPLRKIAANMGGPLPLGDLYLVIPPLKPFRFSGTAAKNVLVRGRILEFMPGEALPSDVLSRFANQHIEFMRTVQGSDVSTGTALADGAEVSLYTLTPTTIESYTFGSRIIVRAAVAGSPVEAEGNLGVRPYVDGVPMDSLLSASGKRGLSRFSLDVPGTTTNIMESLTLEGSPIVVGGDHLFEVKVMNVSGGSLFGTTAAQFRFLAAARYKRPAA